MLVGSLITTTLTVRDFAGSATNMVPKHRTKRYGNSAIPFLTQLLNQSS